MARSASTLTSTTDTIVAPATAPGAAAIAIVRMSGPAAHGIALDMFVPFGAALRDEWGRLRRGIVSSPSDGAIDEALLVLWKGPASATGDDVAEFHLHGSPTVVSAVLEECSRQGARLAEPGEFTRRAFLAGKIDLAQAEAIGALARSQTDAARRAAIAALSGGLSREVAGIRALLVDCAAQFDAAVDFPEDDIESPEARSAAAALRAVHGRIATLLATARRGRSLAEGVRVVLAGPPNAGKSSLFNALLGRERAIVSPHPGTTRDSLEATIEMGGVAVTLVDTAGLRDTTEEIEALGVVRTRGEIVGSGLVVFVGDPGAAREELLAAYDSVREFPHVVVASKCDLLEARADLGCLLSSPQRIGGFVRTSATNGDVAALRSAIERGITAGSLEMGEAAVGSARQELALREALDTVGRALSAAEARESPEIPALHVGEALSAFDRLLPPTPTTVDEDVLDAVFSRFCLGK